MALSLAALQTLRPVQTPDYTARARTLADARNAMQTEQMNALKIQAATTEAEQLQAVQQALIEAQGDVEAALPKILQVAPTLAPQYQKYVEDTRASRIDRDVKANTMARQNFQAMEGQETPTFGVAAPVAEAQPYEGQVGAGPQMGGGIRRVATPMPAWLIPGSKDLKVAEATVYPRNAQQIRDEEAEKARQEQEMELEKIRVRERAQAEFAKPVQPPLGAAALQEYNFYVQQEQAAGRKPLSFDAYQERDANRKRQAVNVNLERMRELELENRGTAAEGQIVFASSGNPVPPGQIGDTASTRLSGFQDALDQADVVAQSLANLGTTGAIKGFVLREGVYWPVVQDNISAEAAAAVSEVQRLVNAYLYAVSGKQINEQEMGRIARTAPDLRFETGANQKILKYFRDYVERSRDNYLKVRGWAIKKPGASRPGTDAGSTEGWSVRVKQ